VQAEGLITEYEHPRAGRYRGFQHAVKFGRSGMPGPTAAPLLGEHSDALLQEMGLSADDIASLRESGALG